MLGATAEIINMQNSTLTPSQCQLAGLKATLNQLSIDLYEPAAGVIENALIFCGYSISNKYDTMSLFDTDYTNCLVFQPSKQNYFTPALQKIPMTRHYIPLSVVLNATTMWVIGNGPMDAGSSDLITLEKGSVVLISHFPKNEVWKTFYTLSAKFEQNHF